jgi:hypothetical protein
MGEAFYYISADRFSKKQLRLRRLTPQECVEKLDTLKRDPDVSWIRVERIEEIYNYFPQDLDLNLIR